MDWVLWPRWDPWVQNTPDAIAPLVSQRVTAVTHFIPRPALTSAPAKELLQEPQEDNQILQEGS